VADQPAPRLAFWIHQIVEYLLGVLLISQAIQSEHPEVPVVLGVGVILLAATADGPLAAFHLVPRRLHRVLDVLAIVAIAVATVVFRDDLGSVGVVFAAAVVVAMAGLVVRTSYAPKSAKPRRAGPPPAASTATAPMAAEPPAALQPAPAPSTAPASPAAPTTPSTSGAPVPAAGAPSTLRSKGEVYSRAAGRALGTGIRSYRARKAAASPPAAPAAAPPTQDEAPGAAADAEGASQPPPPLPPPSPP
jgi:uncharacterized membrane protein (DUF441 family)